MKNTFEIAQKIGQLKARYCRYVDTKDWAGFANLFAQNPELRFYDENGGLVAGFDAAEEFVALTKAYLTGTKTIHQVHNAEIDVVSEREVRAIWSMEDYLLFPEGDDGRLASMRGFGHYHETWKLEAGEWKIAKIELRRTILEIKPKENAA